MTKRDYETPDYSDKPELNLGDGINSEILEYAKLLTQNMPEYYVEDVDGHSGRSIIWARYPYRYMLTERIRREADNKRFFDVTSVSAEVGNTGMHKYSRYYLLPEKGLIATLHHELPLIGMMDEAEKEDLKVALNFAVDNGFTTPALQDYQDILEALRTAYTDGTNPYKEK